VSENLI